MIPTRLVCLLALAVSACASAPPAPPVKAAGPTFEQKMAWILRLEDHRVLRDPEPPPPPQLPPAPPPARRRTPAAVLPPPPPPPALLRLLADPEARVRRRAALAVGHVGLRDGVPPLVALPADTDPEVRPMAALALGR